MYRLDSPSYLDFNSLHASSYWMGSSPVSSPSPSTPVYSTGSMGSTGSIGSMSSVRSIGYMSSVGNIGSVGSIGSIGSIGSLGSMGPAFSVVSERYPWGYSPSSYCEPMLEMGRGESFDVSEEAPWYSLVCSTNTPQRLT